MSSVRLRARANGLAVLACLLSSFSLTGCSGQSSANSVAASTGALQRYLELQVSASVGDSVDPDALNICPPDGQVEPMLIPSRFRLLGVAPKGDTMVVAALVETVAREVGSAGGRRLVQVRTSLDTLHWRLARRQGATNDWRVCGIALEGAGLGSYATDDNADWDPPGFSVAGLRGLVDSLRRIPLK